MSPITTTITIQFKGNETLNEIYKITLDNVNKQIMAITDLNKLKELRLRLLEQVAIVENKIGAAV